MDVIVAMQQIVGREKVAAGAAIGARHLADARLAAGAEAAPLAVVYPANTREVAEIVKLCAAERRPVVAQGGMTGLAGGAIPVRGAVLVSLDRLDQIEEIDADAATMTVGAGVPLEKIQRAADDAGFLFALDLGARGSCRIGGNVSTNAGGNRVLRFGMTRALVMGLEVVLPDGTILSSLNKMMKNNTGYDLKQLFIGAEGTLGIITRLVLRLHPKPRSVATAFCGLTGFDQVLAFLARARVELGETLAAFEGMWPEFYRVAVEVGGRREPIPRNHAYYVLIEAMGSDPARDQARFDEFMERALEDGLIADAVVAQSEAERTAIWGIRDSSGEFLRTIGDHAGFDVSVSIGDIGAFIEDLAARFKAHFPDVKPIFFGHLADGNIHIEISLDKRRRTGEAVEKIVYDATRDWKGSISAEHGIGLLKKPYLAHSRSPEEIAMMRTIKAALDPLNILNPGKVL